MSIPSLTDRLDSLSSADKESAQVVPKDVQGVVQVEMADSNPQFEPTQVAGLSGMIRKAVKEAPTRTERLIVKEGMPVEKIGPYQAMPDVSPEAANVIVESVPAMPTTGKPSPTPTEVAAGVPETAFNLDMIQDEAGVKQYIEAISRQVGADKIQKISYKEVAAKAALEGYDEAFLARIIDPTVATEANMASAYKMLLAVTDAGKRAFDLGEQVKAAKLDGTLTAELASQFQQAIALEGVLVKAARGRQTDIARTLGIFSQARQSTVERGAMLDSILTEAGGIESIHDLANKYTALTSNAARADVAAKSIGGTFKDIWFSTWINGLLSSPITHAKNIAGNMFFGGLQMPERALASAIGKARNFMFKGGEDAISNDELYAQAMGFLQGIREGGEISGKAFKANTPTDPFQKIEASRLGRDAFDIDFGDGETGKAMSNGLKYWGKFVTLPGRALMAEDEFFKAVGYRMELNALAAREGNSMYKTLINAGADPENAAKQSADLVADLLAYPTPDIEEAAKSASRTVTFTRELEESLQGLQRASNYPLIKIFVPFMKTPTNIALEAMSRTPGLNFASPRFWGDYNAGGIRRDQAMARVTLGGAMIYSVSAGIFEGKLTGYGPMRMEDKKALEGTGWQQFSLVFDAKDVDEELMAKFEQLTTVSRGPDKIYVSYAGLEPIATMLGIGATAGEYAQMTPGGGDMDKLAMGGALGVYQYTSEQPMLQGFSDIMKVFSSGAKDAPTLFYDLIKQTSKQVIEFGIGGSPLGVHSSLVANIERIVDPTKSNTMPGQMSTKSGVVEPAVRAFYEAVNYAKSRNSLTSDGLPPSLDTITGEVQTVGKGNLYEAFSPFKVSSGKYNQSKGVLVAYGVPQYIPPKSFDGIQLSAQQYNRWIELATQDGVLEQQIEYLGMSDSLQNRASQDLGAAQNILKKTISDAYEMAKAKLIQEDIDLAEAVKEANEAKRDYGNYKR
jgi:hypothetical protein